LRNKTTTGKEENDSKSAAGNAAFAVDVLFHFKKGQVLDCTKIDCRRLGCEQVARAQNLNDSDGEAV